MTGAATAHSAGGFLKRTSRGREATALAYDHLGLKAPAGQKSDLFGSER